ncbi:MAG: OmpA family protein [Bacteroidota bacterium]
MKWITLILLWASCAVAQTATRQVYFDHDSYVIKPEYEIMLRGFADSINNLSIEKIEVTGWCDDTGTDAYNEVLSLNRAQTVATFFNTPELWAQGKGELPLKTEQNKTAERQKNRRVTVTAYINAPTATPQNILATTATPLVPETKIPAFTGAYKKYGDSLQAGDKILLKNMVFLGGRTKLTNGGRKELENLLAFLKKNTTVRFEIQGHVCCIDSYNEDAVDEDTHIPNLSFARAKYVYDYLVANGIAADRMTYNGYGRKLPIEGGHERDNKRVEILIK